MDFGALKIQLDRWLHLGEGKKASQRILEFAKKKLPRAEAADFASLARRSGEAMVGIQLLSPYVRPKARKPTMATDRERMEYAACLIPIGSIDEAITLLNSVSVSDYPKALLYQAYALMNRWDYRTSIPRLEDYVTSSQISEYDRLVGNTNLVACYIVEQRYIESASLIEELRRKLKNSTHLRLYGNLLELAAQSALDRGDWKESLANLSEAEVTLRGQGQTDLLFVQKWTAITNLLNSSGSRRSLRQLNEVKNAARECAHWETLRSCDLYQAIGTNDPLLFARVYFGTPFSSFREMMVRHHGKQFTRPSQYIYRLGSAGQKGAPVFDLNKFPIKCGQLLHRTLICLCSDFYRPFSITQLFSAVHPDENLSSSSTNRMHVTIKRLRDFLKLHKIPIDLIFDDEGFRADSFTTCGIRLRELPPLVDPQFFALEKLKLVFAGKNFSVGEAEKELDGSRRSALYVLQNGVSKGRLRKEGAGKKTSYRFVV